MCDDIEQTMAELGGRGAQFVGEIAERSFGRCIDMKIPGAGVMLLYQPSHPVAYPLGSSAP